jgi:glutathione S-transferase
MKLLDGGKAPNPRRVRIFFAEKGLPLPELVPVDLTAKQHKATQFAALNPAEQVPVLVLDDGTPLSETVAICRYIEALNPEPPLFGIGAKHQALVEMWNRRLEFGLYIAIQAVFRHGHPGMAAMEQPQIADWAEVNRPRAERHLRLLDARLAESRFVAGDSFTIADITGGICVDLTKPAKLAIPEELTHLRRWHEGLRARPSWGA